MESKTQIAIGYLGFLNFAYVELSWAEIISIF